MFSQMNTINQVLEGVAHGNKQDTQMLCVAIKDLVKYCTQGFIKYTGFVDVLPDNAKPHTIYTTAKLEKKVFRAEEIELYQLMTLRQNLEDGIIEQSCRYIKKLLFLYDILLHDIDIDIMHHNDCTTVVCSIHVSLLKKMAERNMIIAVDFDGTCVTHKYPKIGRGIGAVPVLKRILRNGHSLILHTMRCGKELEDAVRWCSDHDIYLYGQNKNPDQHRWTDSPKVYAHMYIDDSALGVPLVHSKVAGERPYVNWDKVEKMLEEMGVLTR